MASPTVTAPPSAAAPTSTHDVKIEDVGPARKRIIITVPANIVNEKLQESLATLASETALPGFRKGRVPQKLLERRFGTTLRSETKNQIIANAYAAAIEQHEIKPVGEPEPGEDMAALELEQGKPLTFSVEVEVIPTFDLPSFDSIEVKKPMLIITDELIDTELKRQQAAHGVANKIEDGFAEGDRLGGRALVTKNDETEPFFDQPDVLIVVPPKADGGRGQVLGLMIDDLHGTLADKKVGDTVAITATGPEGHEREDIRGAKLTINYEIRMGERIEPAAAEAVAAQFGLDSVDVLREQIRFALEHRRDQEQASAMRDQVIEQLAELIEIDLPEKLSAQQAARNLEQYRLDLLYRGMNTEEVEQKLAEVREESEAATRDRLKKFFILQRLGEHFDIEVSDQEINGRIAAIAAQRGVRPERLRNELSQAGRLGEIARMVRDEKAADRLVQQVKQVEVTAEEWNKIFQAKRAQAGKPAARSKSAKSEKSAKAEKAPAEDSKEKAPAKKRTKKS